DLRQMGLTIHKFLYNLKNYENIGYYAVVFEQPVAPGLVRRGTIVSQSPSMIRQWYNTMLSPRAPAPFFEVRRFETRAQAFFAAQQWLNNR
ncbi:MAG: type IV secretion system protein VirB10, partial [Isosphaeraceae bacterium]|nr:type IV secretion system protein VirB10 [Isosphaeraceae bacterium]